MEASKILIIAGAVFVVGLALYYLYKRPGPWGIFWVSVLILLLGGLGADKLIPIEAAGDRTFEWIPAIFLLVLFAVPVALVKPPSEKAWEGDTQEKAYRRNKMVFVVFFWTIFLFIIGGSFIAILV